MELSLKRVRSIVNEELLHLVEAGAREPGSLVDLESVAYRAMKVAEAASLEANRANTAATHKLAAAAHEKAYKAWEAVERHPDQSDYAAEERADDHYQSARDHEYKAKELSAKRHPQRELTQAQLRSIYNAASSSYGGSYAMMVDDIFAGAKRAGTKYGLEPFYDAPWFHAIVGPIKAFKRWEDLPEDRRQTIVDLANQQLEDDAGRKKRTKKGK